MAITFVGKDDNYYVSDGEFLVPLNDNSKEVIKSMIELPSTLYFHNCPITFIAGLAEELFDEKIDLHIQRIKSTDDSLDYEAIFTKVMELPSRGLK